MITPTDIINTVLAFLFMYGLYYMTDIHIDWHGTFAFLLSMFCMTYYHLPLCFGIIIASYVYAISQDEHSMEVYDVYFYLSIVAIVPMFFYSFMAFNFHLPTTLMQMVYLLIPYLFITFTVAYRGGADTDFLLIAYFIYVMVGVECVNMLIAMLIGYALQFIRQLIACAVEKKGYNEIKKTRRPFLLNLYIGFIVGFFL